MYTTANGLYISFSVSVHNVYAADTFLPLILQQKNCIEKLFFIQDLLKSYLSNLNHKSYDKNLCFYQAICWNGWSVFLKIRHVFLFKRVEGKINWPFVHEGEILPIRTSGHSLFFIYLIHVNSLWQK